MKYIIALILLLGLTGCQPKPLLIPQATLPEEPEILMRPPLELKPIPLPPPKAPVDDKKPN